MAYYNKTSLGNFDQFYIRGNSRNVLFDSFKDALSALTLTDQSIKINFASLLSVLANNFMVGDATIVHGIKRTPWLSNVTSEKIEYYEIPRHANTTLPVEAIANQLYTLLEEEIKDAVGSYKSIGILLSGGMDSRFVAGILANLIKEKSINPNRVTAYTWGEYDSRDHIYAKTIAQELGWEFKPYLVGAEQLWNNIEIAADRGCEYSGIHLHAMPQIGRDSKNQIDIILAGSYGDSVGRAEYGGKHITDVKDLFNSWGRYAHLFSSKKSRTEKATYISYINSYRRRFSKRQSWQINEIEKQCHYMRRMLNPCMETIAENTPLYQVFTHPSVYSFMWSLSPSLRGDDVYAKLLKTLDPALQEIPWARTGIQFGKSGVPDNFKRRHHLYKELLNGEELLEKMESTLLGSALFFNNSAIKVLLQEVKKYPFNNIDYLEKLSYLTSIALFIENNNIKLVPGEGDNSIADQYHTKLEYLAKTRFRALKT